VKAVENGIAVSPSLSKQPTQAVTLLKLRDQTELLLNFVPLYSTHYFHCSAKLLLHLISKGEVLLSIRK